LERSPVGFGLGILDFGLGLAVRLTITATLRTSGTPDKHWLRRKNCRIIGFECWRKFEAPGIQCKELAVQCGDLGIQCEELSAQCGDLGVWCEALSGQCKELSSQCEALRAQCKELSGQCKELNGQCGELRRTFVALSGEFRECFEEFAGSLFSAVKRVASFLEVWL